MSALKKLSDRAIGYMQSAKDAAPHKLKFNKSGFSSLQMMGDGEGNKVVQPLTVTPVIKTDGSLSDTLSYSDQYSKWTIAAMLNKAEMDDIDMWYANFRLFFQQEYGLVVDFRPPHRDGTIYMNWPRIYVDKVPLSNGIRVDISNGGFTQSLINVGPEAMKEMPDYKQIVANGSQFVVNVIPSVWVRTEDGKNTAGVTWNIDSIKFVKNAIAGN